MRKFGFLLGLVILGLAFWHATILEASPLPKVEVVSTGTGSNEPAQLQISGKSVASLKTPNGNLSPKRRAEIGLERIQAIIAKKPRPWKVTSGSVNGRYCVLIEQTTILVATKAEAAAHGVSPQRLADLWAAGFDRILNTPPLTAEPKSLTIPLGETRAVTTGGYLDSPLSVEDSPDKIAECSVDSATRCVRVKGLAVGKTSIRIKCEGEGICIPVEVKKYAGRVGTAPVMTVTGRPAPSDLLEQAMRSAVSQSAIPEEGATYRIVSMDVPEQLEAGKGTDAGVRLAFSGPAYLPIEVRYKVRIKNMALASMETARLLYSNSPERLMRYGTLFVGQITAGELSRLLYHHQNAMGKPVRLIIEVLNPGATPAQLQVIDGTTPPIIDTILVGYNAARNFLYHSLRDIGYVADLPPASSIRLVSQTLAHDYTSSGILGLRQIGGSPLMVIVQAADETWSVRNLPDNLPNSPWVFPNPVKNVDAEYEVGKQWAFIRIGKHAITDGTEANRRLDGNYGVIYNLNIRVSNPTQTARRIDVLFEGTAGPARAIFLNGNEIIKVRHTAAPSEEQVLSVTLQPGETRKFTLQTMPLAGSNYPATVIVKS